MPRHTPGLGLTGWKAFADEFGALAPGRGRTCLNGLEFLWLQVKQIQTNTAAVSVAAI